MRLFAALAGGAALLALSAPAVLAAPVLRPAQSVDAPATTASGAGFVVARDWSASVDGPVTVLTAPEGDARLAIVEVGAAPDAAAAVARAWAALDPAFARKVELTSPQPPRNGWTARVAFSYETLESERLGIQAVALRKGADWTVVLVRGSGATLEKRGAAVGQMMQSLRPAGYARESFAGRRPHRMDARRLAELKAFLETGMKQLGVPGAGLAVIDHGKVVFEGGLGVKQLGRPEPVGAHTLFMIASNTKGMSTLLLSRLADEGRLGWTQKVTDLYPDFRLGSAETTSKVLVRNLVCACTGLPRKDLEWIFNSSRDTPASNAFRLLAATEPTSRFGEVFQYNNQMAAAAGYVGAHLLYPDMELGAAYDRAMQVKIFDPLGMKDTTFDFARAQAGDFARPYSDDLDGRPALVAMDINYTGVPTRPAGAAWSSAHDMIRYVRNELTLGRLPDGRRLVSARNLLVRREPSVPTGEDTWYGMGLMVDRTTGVEVVHHGGSMLGYKSDWIAIPDAQVGAVLLTNADNGGALLHPFMRRVLELLYDGEPQAAADVAAAAARIHAAAEKARSDLASPPPAEALAHLATDYVSPELGRIQVRREAGGGVYFHFGAWGSHIAARREADGAWVYVLSDPGSLGMTFAPAVRDGKPVLITRDGQHEYVYTARN